MINKKLAVIVAAALAFGATSFAQTKAIEHDFSAFSALEASNDFEVTLVISDKYSATLTVDEALADYVKAYVKGKSLYIELDEKSVPKDTKKAYKEKNAAAPVLTAVVRVPSINSIKISDNVTLSSTEAIRSDKFSLTVEGSANVKALNIDASSATINAEKKSTVVMTTSADDIEVNASGSTNFKLTYDCRNLTLNPSGSALVSVSGEAKKVAVKAAGSSQTQVAGNADELTINGQGSSNINAASLSVDSASVVLSNSCTVNENASKSLKMELSGNSTLNFGGDPKIEIVSIKSSTVQHLGK